MLADAERNHRAWFGRARSRVELDGVELFLGDGDAVLAFPDADGDLDEAVRLARESGARGVGCWSLRPDGALGARLAALGFQDGWQPHWMGRDPGGAFDAPAHDVEESTACARGLPYASAAHEAVLGGDVHHFVARSGAEVVGHAVLNVDGGDAGIYDMGVSESFRRQGFGRALTLAAVACARVAGCASVTLNATGEGEPMYASAGFQSLGHGMTWWLFPR